MSNENPLDRVAGLFADRSAQTTDSVNTIETGDPNLSEPSQTEKVNLPEQIRLRGYHPVMLFGTRSSGKTTLLASLFSYANTDVRSPGSVSLGEPLVPPDTPDGQRIDSHVQRIFNEHVLNFADGKPAPRTDEDVRIFMPVVFSPNRGNTNIKIAFLESSGEDYKVDESEAGYFKKLKKEILDLYSSYSGSISIIIAAPYIIESIHSITTKDDAEQRKEERDSDRALYAALQNYQQFRNPKFRHLDRFLFVLTKWDEHTKGVNNKAFLNPTTSSVMNVIAEKFEKSWIFFQKIKGVKNKSVLVYSAGIMTGEVRLKTPERYQSTLSVFPRKLWTWIIRGAKNDRYDQFIEAVQKIFGPIIAFVKRLFL